MDAIATVVKFRVRGKSGNLKQHCFRFPDFPVTRNLHAQFILIHPTVWPHYTNVTDRTGQTDSIGRTVLQTVAQKSTAGIQSPLNFEP